MPTTWRDRPVPCLSWALALVLGAAYGSFAAQPAQAAPMCQGKPATLVGRPGDDTLKGTPGPDVIAGLGGNDTIKALGGDDVVCGGPGRDYIEAGGGADTVSGGAGKDGLLGDGGNDELFGGRGNDYLRGDGGDDTVVGGLGSDLIDDGPGNDVIDGGPGTGDIASYGAAPGGVTVDLQAGTATGDGTDTLSGIEGAFGSMFDDVITGDDRPNDLVGRDGNDVLTSGGGGSLECAHPQPSNVAPLALRCADILEGEGGDDTLTGGAGLDVVMFFDSPAVSVDLGKGMVTGEGTDTLRSVEGVWGSRNDDTLIGDDGDNVFLPDQGSDVIEGGGGIDLVSFGDVGSVSVNLTAGTATAGYLGHPKLWTYALSGIESVWGTGPFPGFADGADTIVGDAGPNDLRGFGGADTISGGDGDDRLDGGAGTDTLDGGRGIDTCLNGETVSNCES